MTFFRTFFGHDIDFSKAATMFSIHNLIYIVLAVLTILIVLRVSNRVKSSNKEYYLKRYWIGLLIILEIMYHIHNWSYPRFSIPLHICSFAVMANIYLLFTDSKKAFNYAFFFGICGGLMALSFPNSWGYTYLNFRYYHFIILHCTIIAVPIYYYKAYGYRVDYKTLVDVFKNTMILGIAVFLVNGVFLYYGIDSNYWFLNYIPDNVSNFFTSYPVYIMTFIALMFTSMNLLYVVSNFKEVKEKLLHKIKKDTLD
ncbi:TIGR02206 family membrane protein [Candidatus Izimaplasma bacterium]|nr:TIGR02206 family membrane protein [Candidatus Izimaplasma bacterium]